MITTTGAKLAEMFGFTKDVEPKDGDGDGLVFDGTEQERAVDPENAEQQHTTRSFVYDRGQKMALADTVSASVVAHEFGHVIEYQNPHIHRLAKGFLSNRVGDEKPTRLADKFEGYGSTEFGRKDNFDRVFDEHSSYYIGKHYDDATEVISMGMEQLHRDPVKFAENDPEYFDLMIGALQGVLK